MNAVEQVIRKVSESAHSETNSDYIGGNGLRHCGTCNAPKQCRIVIHGKESIVNCICKCEKHSQELEQLCRQRDENERQRCACFTDDTLRSAVFACDDMKNAELSKLCRRYAETFTNNSKWLLLYGTCGTGKSYAAAMIANALIDKGLSCRFTSIPEIECQLWGNQDKSAVYHALLYCDLLILDDFGTERKTDYMNEIRFSVIDGRLRSGRACIITTNLSVIDFSTPADLTEKRIVSRIFEKCIPYEVKGTDRRFEMMRMTSRSELAKLLNDS